MTWLRSAIDRFGSFRRMPWKRRWLLLRVMASMSLIALELRLWGVRRFRTAVNRQHHGKRPPQHQCEENIQAATTTANVVTTVSRRLFRSNCLVASLTLWRLLDRQGFDCQLVIGSRKRGEKFQAHAWVRMGNVILNAKADVERRFAPLQRSALENHCS